MGKPWYKDYRNYLIEATSLLESLNRRYSAESDDLKLLGQFFSDLEREYYTKFIFESNNIEREGLPEGKTRKLVLEIFEETDINEKLEKIKNQLFNVKIDLIPKKIINYKEMNNLDTLDIELLTLKYKDKKKDIILVLNSLNTLYEADSYLIGHIEKNIHYLIDKNVFSDEMKKSMNYGLGHPISKVIRSSKNNEEVKYLFTEEKIKKLHETLSDKMNNNDNGVPGEYRPDSAYADAKTVFLEPTLIKGAMANLIKKHEERYTKESYNPFIESCKFTGDFIMIHPFGDFNGRISRILLNMVLQLEMVPFYIILRSTNREKRKYMTSMKHYYQGRPNTYLALVCKDFIEEIESINSRLKIAGISPIEPVQLTEYQIKLIDDSLKDYNNMAYKF